MLDNLWSKLLSVRTAAATITPPKSSPPPERQQQQQQHQHYPSLSFNHYYHRRNRIPPSKRTVAAWQEQERILWATRMKLHNHHEGHPKLRNTVHLRNMLKKLRQGIIEEEEDDNMPLAMLRHRMVPSSSI